jgi:hypothetical protein
LTSFELQELRREQWCFMCSIGAWGGCEFFSMSRTTTLSERVVEQTLRVAPLRTCAGWLPNHWHFVLWP